jgi:hypothetical protein
MSLLSYGDDKTNMMVYILSADVPESFLRVAENAEYI